MQKIYDTLITKIDEDRVLLDEPMKNHTTFRVGGPADIFVKVNTLEELEYVLQVAKEFDLPITVIGNGSNTLVTDKGIRGIVIKLDLNDIVLLENNSYIAYAGVGLPRLSRIAMEDESTGLEFACGIPASIGGAIYMNCGAYNKQISDVLLEVTYLDDDFNLKISNKEDLDFSYRHSIFQEKNWIIISAKIQLEKGEREEISSMMKKYLTSRGDTQPLNMPSAGSVFKRGEEFYAAHLIEESGLKGYCIGDAEVSLKHAGFIVNKGNATACDILELISVIKQKVKEKNNKELELEIKVLGEE